MMDTYIMTSDTMEAVPLVAEHRKESINQFFVGVEVILRSYLRPKIAFR